MSSSALEDHLDIVPVRVATPQLPIWGSRQGAPVGSTVTLPSAAIDPGAERQGRNMPFADRAQAEDEATSAFRRAGLIGMGDDARIEQRRRFEGIFVQEIGADQLALVLGEGGVGGERLFHLVGARLERRRAGCDGAPGSSPAHRRAGWRRSSASSARTRSTIWFARVLSVGLRSRGSVAGLNGRTITRAGSGRRWRACRFRNVACDNATSVGLNGICSGSGAQGAERRELRAAPRCRARAGESPPGPAGRRRPTRRPGSRWRGRDASRRGSCRFPDRPAAADRSLPPRNQAKARSASIFQSASPSARHAARQAEIVAVASSGC